MSRAKHQFSDRETMIASGLIFKIALDACYTLYLSPAFESHFLTPFVLNFSISRFAESYIWTVVALTFMPASSRSASGLALLCGFVFLYAPVATIYGLDLSRSRLTIALTLLAMSSCYLTSAIKIGRRVKVPVPTGGQDPVLVLSLFSCFLFLAICVVSGAVFYMSFDLDKVYELRTLRSADVDIGLLAYTNLWAQKVFTPLILAIGLQRQSLLLIGFALSMHLMYFGVTQHRVHIFTPLLVIMAYQIYRHEFAYGAVLLISSILLIVGMSVVSVLDLQNIAALTIRRSIFVGASVTYSWIDFFLYNPKTYFSDNLLSKYISNSYTGVNLPRYMGEHMRPGMLLSFNVGLVGAGFAQLGALGVIVYGMIIGAIARFNAKLIDAGVPPYIHAAVLFLPYRIAWADADVPTALLSHGLAVGSMSVWLFGKRRTITGTNFRTRSYKLCIQRADIE